MVEKTIEERKPYQQAFFASKPTKFTKFLRTCVVWQLVKFIIINIKMTLMLLKSHK
ncbi:MAG: hypothetical protein ACP5GK_08450 [Desulfurella sp.]|uniref:hypothetical protein n=1 Tax=Desulfurella sp. TaxID=1962857 RepID=UPI00257DD1BD|nr:hypothetical protein [Desulfurella sp.]